MRVGRGALLMALALGACSKSGTTGTDALDAGSIGLPGRPSTLAMPSCEELLPADLRDITLNGFTMKEERACPTCGPLCSLRSAAQADVSVSVAYDCQPNYANTDVRALLAPMLNAGGEEIPALGKAAARRSPVQGMTQVVAWDDDTPCVVVVTWLGEDPDRAMDVARIAVTSNHGVVDSTADAGTEPLADAGDSLLLDGPLEPLDSLTTPRTGTTDQLSAPSNTGTVLPPPIPAPRPANVQPVAPPPRKPVQAAPVPVTPPPTPAAQKPAQVAPTPTSADQKPAAPAPTPAQPAPTAQKPAHTEPAATPPTPAAQKPTAPAPTPATQTPAQPAPVDQKPAAPATTPATQTPAQPAQAAPVATPPSPADQKPAQTAPSATPPSPAAQKPAAPTPATQTPAQPAQLTPQ